MVVSSGRGRASGGDYNMGMGVPFRVTKMFWTKIEVVIAQHTEGTKCY